MPVMINREARTVAGQIQILWTPGHSDGHICLFEEKEGVLLAGDHLLYEIKPNISYWPLTDENPLNNYLQSMDIFEKLPIRLVLPGHGQVFQNITE
ncbi:Metallo-beta-lactamase superfamily protein [Desulfoscipio geothermicus DSM 3669]|uniref:Metallo-beta-lactamase superfamily protein n=2 Tax=Desulfoscipio geothermicus TaxID=39060 RepID=A0A1I6EM29_9FIRM|nr:Metallo-beta-lactamase superfamily protein [Desulfoscipio geothermicus DSM 3669]